MLLDNSSAAAITTSTQPSDSDADNTTLSSPVTAPLATSLPINTPPTITINSVGATTTATAASNTNNSTTTNPSSNSYEAFFVQHVFADPHHLTVHDYAALGCVCGALAAYWALFKVRNYCYPPHTSLPSHFGYQRVAWAQYVWGSAALKILTIQNVRSVLMVLGSFLQTAVTAAVAMGAIALKPWGAYDYVSNVPATPQSETMGSGDGSSSSSGAYVRLRSLLPLAVLLVGLYHLLIATGAYTAILFLSTCEDMSGALPQQNQEGGGGGSSGGVDHTVAADVDSAAIIVDDTTRIAINGYSHRKSHAVATVLTTQAAAHVRSGWRLLCVGLCGMFWAQSPAFFLISNLLLVVSFYYNDFGSTSHSLEREMREMAHEADGRRKKGGKRRRGGGRGGDAEEEEEAPFSPTVTATGTGDGARRGGGSAVVPMDAAMRAQMEEQAAALGRDT